MRSQSIWQRSPINGSGSTIRWLFGMPGGNSVATECSTQFSRYALPCLCCSYFADVDSI